MLEPHARISASPSPPGEPRFGFSIRLIREIERALCALVIDNQHVTRRAGYWCEIGFNVLQNAVQLGTFQLGQNAVKQPYFPDSAIGIVRIAHGPVNILFDRSGYRIAGANTPPLNQAGIKWH